MPQPIGSAYAQISLNQRNFNTQLAGMGTAFQRSGRGMMGMAKQISGSFLGIAAGAGAVTLALKAVNKAVDRFVSFDTKLRNIWTLTDMTWEQMQKLGEEVTTLSNKYGKLGTEGLDAMYQIYSAGFAGADGINVFTAALEGSIAGLSSVFTAAEVVTSVLNAFNLSASQAGDVMDAVFKTIKLGVVTMDSLAGGLGRVIAVAGPLGLTFSETLSAVATLTKALGKVNLAATALKGGLTELMNPTDELKGLMKGLGYESGLLMIQELGLQEVIRLLNQEVLASGKMWDVYVKDVRAMTGILPLATTLSQVFADTQEEMADRLGATNEALEKQKGYAFLTSQAIADLDRATTRLGEAFAGLIGLKIGLKNFFAFMIEDFTILIDKVGWLLEKLQAIGRFLETVQEYPGRPGMFEFGEGEPIPGPIQISLEDFEQAITQGFTDAWDTMPDIQAYMPWMPTKPSDVTAPEAVLGPWTDAFDELVDTISEDPTGGTAAIRAFLDVYGEVPAALLAGANAASAVLGDLEQLQTLGMGAFTDDIVWLEDFLGIAAERAKRLAEDQEREAERAASEAERLAKASADQAIRDARALAAKEARAAEEVFNRQFIDPIAKALRTGDWLGAAETISVMAGSLPEMIAAAEVMAKKHGLDIENLDVLEKLVGMEGMLISALEARIAIAERAGELDLAESLKKQLAIITPEEAVDPVAEFQEEWGGMIDGILGMLPSEIRDILDGIYDVMIDVASGSANVVVSALQLVSSIFQGVISMLEEKKTGLEQVLDTYISAYESIGGLAGGGIIGGAVDLLVSSIRMLTLEGIDLVAEGMNSLIGFINVLVSSFQRLISSSDASAAIQEESQTIWKAIGNLLGEFLWPVAAALRLAREWLGIPGAEGGTSRAGQVGVPAGYKMERLRYQAIAPGEKVFGEEVVEIPAWAEPVGEALANAIMEVLASIGITSWTDLMEGARRVAQNVWGWISTRLPAMVTSAITAIDNVRTVLKDAGITWESIGEWLKKGVDFIIAEFPKFATGAAKFFVSVAEAAVAIATKLGELPTWAELSTKWTEFTETLKDMGTFSEVANSISDLGRIIDVMKTTLAIVMGAAAGAIVGALIGTQLGLNPMILAGALAGALTGGFISAVGLRLHDGGIVPGMPGQQVPMVAMAGETVLPTHKAGFGLRPVVIPIILDGRKVGEGMVKWVSNEGYELSGHSNSSSGWTKRGT